MTGKLNYPLAQVLAVKKDRVEKAEKVVEAKKQALLIEEEKLKKIEGERDAIKLHQEDKKKQLNEAFDKGTTSDEVLQMKRYIKIVDEKVVKAEQKVKQQLGLVKQAEGALAEAKEQLRLRRLEEQKITLHKEAWEKEMKIELAREEGKEHDEIGQLMHESQKRNERCEG